MPSYGDHKNLGAFMIYQLKKHGIKVAYESPDNVMVYCVKGHDVKTPSLSIDKLKGRYYCFGCGLKGRGWNSLAKLIGAQQLKPGNRPDPAGIFNQEVKQYLNSTNGQLKRDYLALPDEFELEPWSKPWRGISAYTMDAATAYEWYDEKDQCYRLLLPIYMFGEVNGYVARRLDKNKDKIRKYRNSEKFGSKRLLYPVDLISQMSTQSVALVEGPHDALRCVDRDIPTLCNFGANMWTKFKVTILANLGIKRVVIASDFGAAGEKLRATLMKDLAGLFEVDHFHCPSEKRDPGNLTPKLYKQLWQMVNG